MVFFECLLVRGSVRFCGVRVRRAALNVLAGAFMRVQWGDTATISAASGGMNFSFTSFNASVRARRGVVFA